MKIRARYVLAGIFLLLVLARLRASGAEPEPEGEPSGWRLPYINPPLLRLGALLRPRELWRARTKEKVAALTFDDGPSEKYFAEVLDVLAQRRVKATFFLIGDRLEKSPASEKRRANVVRAIRDGHEIAFHGWHHQPVSELSPEQFEQSLRRFKATLEELAPGTPVRFFRPPFGRTKPYLHQVLARHEMRIVEADVLVGDVYYFPSYYLEDRRRGTARVIRGTRPGSIVCLHVGAQGAADDQVYDAIHAREIVGRVIPGLAAKGYRFARMSELFPPVR